MYTGYLLSDESRNRLKALYPPKYPDFIGHHVTAIFGVKADTPPPEMPESIRVIGYADDGEKVEGFLVEVDGTIKRPAGGVFHLTWSIDRSLGAKPVDTNEVIKNANLIDHIEIKVTPKNFTKA
jgi:hypothetical protein